MQQLAEVERLAASLQIGGDVGYTCETAAHFFLFHVFARWYVQLPLEDEKLTLYNREEFEAKVKGETDPLAVSKNFPFLQFFESAPQPIFKCSSFEEGIKKL